MCGRRRIILSRFRLSGQIQYRTALVKPKDVNLLNFSQILCGIIVISFVQLENAKAGAKEVFRGIEGLFEDKSILNLPYPGEKIAGASQMSSENSLRVQGMNYKYGWFYYLC